MELGVATSPNEIRKGRGWNRRARLITLVATGLLLAGITMVFGGGAAYAVDEFPDPPTVTTTVTTTTTESYPVTVRETATETVTETTSIPVTVPTTLTETETTTATNKVPTTVVEQVAADPATVTSTETAGDPETVQQTVTEPAAAADPVTATNFVTVTDRETDVATSTATITWFNALTTNPQTGQTPGIALSASEVTAGGPVTLTGRGYTPGERVNLTLHSKPVLLGTTKADSNGDIQTTVTIPSDTQVGQHTIHVVGVTCGVDTTIPITVVTGPAADTAATSPLIALPDGSRALSYTGVDTATAGSAAAVLIGAGAAMTVIARRRRPAKHRS